MGKALSGARVKHKLDLKNFSTTAVYFVKSYEEMSKEEFDELCKRSAEDKANSLCKTLLYHLRLKAIYDDFEYNYSLQSNASNGTYTITVKLTNECIEHINKSEAEYKQRLKLKEEQKEKELQATQDNISQQIDELYNSYIEKLNSIADIDWAFGSSFKIDKEELTRRAAEERLYYAREGIGHVRDEIIDAIKAYTVDLDDIYYFTKDVAITFVNGKVKRYATSKFIDEFGDSLYVDLYKIGNYTPLNKSAFYRKSAKHFKKIYYKSNNSKFPYQSLLGWRNNTNILKITRDANGNLDVAEANSAFNPGQNMMRAIKEGMTWNEAKEALKQRYIEMKNKQDAKRNQDEALKIEVESRGIKKENYSIFDKFALDTLSNIGATDTLEVVQFINTLYDVVFYNSNLAVDLNLDTPFDTIKIYFRLCNMDKTAKETVEFIRSHIKSISVLAKAVVESDKKFIKANIPINLFSYKCRMFDGITLEYIFTLKNKIYELAGNA